MHELDEGKLRFVFPKDWDASKFDKWSFYRKQFLRIGDAGMRCIECDNVVRCSNCNSKRIAGSKGIDILALSPNSVCWQIEIKDYRTPRVTDFIFLADEVALKVRDTLACLVAAKINATDSEEQARASNALKCRRIRVVLHLEAPPTNNSLVSRVSQMANVRQRLTRLVKAIDPHPLVVCMADMNNLNWKVTQVTQA